MLGSCSPPERSSLPDPAGEDPTVDTPSGLNEGPNGGPNENTAISTVETLIATIFEIHQSPVWVRQLEASEEVEAQENMGLQAGETIRTEGDALAQINLQNGLSFRIGGNSILTLQPDNRLNLEAGEMITWVTPGQKVPTEIVTPTAIAAIRGTTVFIKIPEDPTAETEFLAWEGTVAVRLPDDPSNELLLQAGERIRIGPGPQNWEKLRQRVEKLPRAERLRRRRQSRLINDFRRPLETLKQIDDAIPAELRSWIPQGSRWATQTTEPLQALSPNLEHPVQTIVKQASKQASALVRTVDSTGLAPIPQKPGAPGLDSGGTRSPIVSPIVSEALANAPTPLENVDAIGNQLEDVDAIGNQSPIAEPDPKFRPTSSQFPWYNPSQGDLAKLHIHPPPLVTAEPFPQIEPLTPIDLSLYSSKPEALDFSVYPIDLLDPTLSSIQPDAVLLVP